MVTVSEIVDYLAKYAQYEGAPMSKYRATKIVREARQTSTNDEIFEAIKNKRYRQTTPAAPEYFEDQRRKPARPLYDSIETLNSKMNVKQEFKKDGKLLRTDYVVDLLNYPQTPRMATFSGKQKNQIKEYVDAGMRKSFFRMESIERLIHKMLGKISGKNVQIKIGYVINRNDMDPNEPITSRPKTLIYSRPVINREKNPQYIQLAIEEITKFLTDTHSAEDHYRGDIIPITVEISVYPDGDMQGQGGQTYSQFTNKYVIISPESRTNCFFTSLAICMKWQNKNELLYDKEKQNNAGRDLKRKVNPSVKEYADENTAKEACEKLGISLIIYNNIFEKKVVIGNRSPIYKLWIKDNHFAAVISKKELGESIKLIPVSQPEPKLDKYSVKVRGKKKSEEPFDENIYVAYDIETFVENSKHVPYKAGIGFMVDGEQQYHSFDGTDCLEKMMVFVHSHIEFFDGKYFYAHNGGKFDLNLLLENFITKTDLFTINTKKCVELNNAWIGFGLTSGKCSIFFRDSFRMFMGSLADVCKDLKTPHQKLEGDVDHSKVNRDNFHLVNADKYLMHDVLGLLEAVLIFGMEVHKACGVHLYECLTSATLAKKSFFTTYYDENKTPLYVLDDKTDQFIRKGYFGGMVQCFAMGTSLGKYYYYDFTSLYPDQGRNPLPYGSPTKVNTKYFDLDKFYGFCRCLVTGTKEMLNGARPIHAVKDKSGRLVFPYVNGIEMHLFSEEMKYGAKLGYKYEIIEAYKFSSSPFLKQCFEDAFFNKAKAEKDGKPALVSAYKIIANSTYGFFGLRKKDRDGVMIGKDIAYQKYIDEGKLSGIGRIGNYDVIRMVKDLDLKDVNVGVSAAIASYSRMKTHSLINALEKKGGVVLYCDTDSIITDTPIDKFEDIQSQFQPDKEGIELGSLKNECTKAIMKVYKNEYQLGKDMIKKLVEDEGELYFDTVKIVGCKAYCVQKHLPDGKLVSINKLKGFSQRSPGGIDYDKLISGGTISQKQMQFSCNKQAMLNESDSFRITTRFIDKGFKALYTKGTYSKSDLNEFGFAKVEHILL